MGRGSAARPDAGAADRQSLRTADLDCLAASATRVSMVGHEGHQRDLPGPQNGRPKGTLVFGANTGAAARLNLGPL